MKLNIGAPHIVHQYTTYVQIKGISTECRTRSLYYRLGLLIKRVYLSQHALSAVQCGMRRVCRSVLITLTGLFTHAFLSSHYAKLKLQAHVTSTLEDKPTKQLKNRAAAWRSCATPAVKPTSLQHRLLFNRELPIILPTTLPPLQIVSTNLSCPQVLGGNRVSTIDTHVYILMFNSVPLRTYAERNDYLNLWRLWKVFTERCMDSLNGEKSLKVFRIRPPVLLKPDAWKNKGLGVLTYWLIAKGIIWKNLSLVFRAKRTSPFQSGGASVQSTAGRRGVRISGSNGSNAGYTMFQRWCEGYWLPTPFASFPFTSPPMGHRVPSRFNWTLNTYCFSKAMDKWRRLNATSKRTLPVKL